MYLLEQDIYISWCDINYKVLFTEKLENNVKRQKKSNY